MPGLDDFKGKTALTADAKPRTFSDLLTTMAPQFKAALPAHLKENSERYIRMAVTEFRRNPQLSKCDPYSVLGAAMLATQLGLEVGPGGRAYLIPYKTECTFVPGWKGLVELAQRSGRASVWTGAVFEGDTFEYELGDNPHVKHKPCGEDDPAKITHVYGIGRVKGSEYPVIEIWTAARVKKHRDRFNKVGDRHYSFAHWEMYARKVVLLQVLKYMPYSPELEAAIVMDAAAERGIGTNVQNAQDALEGTFTIPADEQPSPSPAAAGGVTGAPVAGVSSPPGGGEPDFNPFDEGMKLAKKGDIDGARSLLGDCAPIDRKLLQEEIDRRAK